VARIPEHFIQDLLNRIDIAEHPWTGTEPLPDAELVTSGAYEHVRHPVYTGIVLLLTGYTLAWSNWTLALVVGFVALLYFHAKARAEERWLVRRFPAYEDYMRHVRRRVL
jgi:protein-S-isoprenylcysteine O-methyltransferase Ste14